MSSQLSIIQTLKKGASSAFDKIFDNPFQDLGLNWFELRRVKYLETKKLKKSKLLGRDIFFYGREEYLHGLKEIFVDKIYFQILPPNALIIDCGAHIGLSVLYLKHLCPTAKIIAFEPDPANFEILSSNIASHQLTEVDLRNEAVWNSNTTLNFVADGTMSSKIGTTNAQTIVVQAVRLRDLLVEKIAFLKLDIEGAEFDVIKDISDKLQLVDNLFIEYHGLFNQNLELIELLEIVVKSNFSYYIKEASQVFDQPFSRSSRKGPYDIQLNIFCFKK